VRDLSRPWLAVSAIGLSLTLQISDGFYYQPALPWLGLSLIAALLGLSAVRWPWGVEAAEADAATHGLLTAGVLLSALSLVSKPLARYMADPRPWHHPELLVAVGAASVVVVSVRAGHGSAAWRRAGVLIVAVGLWLGAWTVRQSPTPHIDVMPVHASAFASVARGESPYSITFENIYRAEEGFYASGMRAGTRVLFGYPYPPLSLALAWPGHAVLGDLRYSEVAALGLAAALLVWMRSREGLLCAGALVLAPRLVFHIEQGWTEPFPIALMALTVATALGRPRLAWLPLGLLMASKQHMALGLAFAPMLVAAEAPSQPQAWSRARASATFMLKAIGVAAVVTLPLAVLDLPAFIKSAVLLQLREPFRLDSLSFTRELLLFGVPLEKQGAMALSLAAGAVGLVLAWWRAPRTPAGFAASLGTTCFLLTAFGKKAFLNYYFMVVAFLLIAIAASGRRVSTPATPVPAPSVPRD
jgi:hypothetical protein